MTQLHFENSQRTVQDLIGLYENDRLNLEPGFQRASVWQDKDRRKLIESILSNYPVPSIFLHKDTTTGRLVYNVLDGKQRLETILMFIGAGKFKKLAFPVTAQIDSEESEEWKWQSLQRNGHEHRLTGYKISTVEVSGDLSDVIEVFVRINSTGKSLTSAEVRHAKYFNSSFLQAAEQLARKQKSYLSTLLTGGQISRMKHVELVCELMASINNGGVIDKKKAVDRAISGDPFDRRALDSCGKTFVRVLNIVKRMFPQIDETRFAKVVDFYTLFMLVHEMDEHEYVLTDPERNRQAQELLIWLSNGVDRLRQQVRRAEGATDEQSVFRDYLFTVQGDTDGLATRKRRATILRQVLGGLFEQKDSRRSFTTEQRRLMWHSDEHKKCAGCGETLTWNNFTLDHVTAHAKGGRTDLTNAALRCRPCNSSKGAKKLNDQKPRQRALRV